MKMKNKYQRGFFNMFFVFFIILLTACNESKNDDNSSKINTPPSALNDNIRLQIDESASIDVLENDIDPDGKIDNKTLTITQPPLHGEANVSDAKINYSPDENYFGHDQIRYQISDNKNASAEALVFIFINKPPTANDDDISVAAGFPVTFDPLDNDYDSDGYINKTDFKILNMPSDNSIMIKNQKVTYTPPAKFSGKVILRYSIEDNDNAIAKAKIIIHVYVNKPPKAVDDIVYAYANEPITFTPLKNDSDADGEINESSFKILDMPSDNSIIINSYGVIYTPPPKFTGVVRFSYSISDNNNASSEAAIFIKVKRKTISLAAESGGRVYFSKNSENFYSRGGGAGGGRGFNIAIFDNVTGNLIEAPRNYDTWGQGEPRGKELADYINFDVPVGAIVMLAVGDSAGNYGKDLINALQNLGATQAGNIGWRNSWAFIAIKGGKVLDEARVNGHWSPITAYGEIILKTEDAHGSTLTAATRFDLDNAILGYLYEKEIDMFKIDLRNDGILTITNSKTDISLTSILDSSGDTITTSSDYQSYSDNSVKRYFKSGVYYIKVEGLSEKPVESFVLKSKFIIDPPLPENLTFTAQSSSRVNFSVNEKAFFARSGGAGGGRGFNIAVIDKATGAILVAGKNYDTWGQGEAAGIALSSYIKNLNNGLMLLLAVGDSAGRYGAELANTLKSLGATQAGDIGWRNTWAFITIKGGKVLDEVRVNGHWSPITAKSTITVPGHDFAGETYDQAANIRLNSITPSYMQKNDFDFYVLNLDDSKLVWIETRGNVDTILRLFKINTSGNPVMLSSSDQGGSASNFMTQQNLPAGRYYLEITGHGIFSTGQYDLLITTN